MNPLQKLAQSLGFGQKAVERADVRFPARSFLMFDAMSTSIDDIADEIGDGSSSDVLMSCVRWLQRAALEAPLVSLDSEGEMVERSEMVDLIASPNEFYGMEHLISGTLFDLSLSGNSYWLIVENGNGRVAEVWWLPASAVEPTWVDNPSPEQIQNGDHYISHYEYRVAGQKMDLDRKDVIHFRQGVDPSNIRRGLSPVRGLLRELWTDNEAANYTASLLKRGGVPGIVVSPAPSAAGEAPYTFDDGVPEAIKAKIDDGTTRSQRG